jgi:hypothetical protein
MLAAVIDGIGHSSKVASVANLARGMVVAYADEPVVSLIHLPPKVVWCPGSRDGVTSIDAESTQDDLGPQRAWL